MAELERDTVPDCDALELCEVEWDVVGVGEEERLIELLRVWVAVWVSDRLLDTVGLVEMVSDGVCEGLLVVVKLTVCDGVAV